MSKNEKNTVRRMKLGIKFKDTRKKAKTIKPKLEGN